MRRFLLLAAVLLPALAPGSALAGTCPALAQGVVDKDVYRLGEVVDFYGTYNDFADPGTVTIEFERTADGATRQFTAQNSPDGSWYLMLNVDSSADLGRWDVTVVVDQTSGLDTCTDRVTIRSRSGAPDTATSEPAQDPMDTGQPIGLALIGLATAVLSSRRLATARLPRP